MICENLEREDHQNSNFMLHLRDLNSEAEKTKSFGEVISEDFQRRWLNYDIMAWFGNIENHDYVDDQIDVNHAHGAYCNDTMDININW